MKSLLLGVVGCLAMACVENTDLANAAQNQVGHCTQLVSMIAAQKEVIQTPSMQQQSITFCNTAVASSCNTEETQAVVEGNPGSSLAAVPVSEQCQAAIWELGQQMTNH